MVCGGADRSLCDPMKVSKVQAYVWWTHCKARQVNIQERSHTCTHTHTHTHTHNLIAFGVCFSMPVLHGWYGDGVRVTDGGNEIPLSWLISFCFSYQMEESNGREDITVIEEEITYTKFVFLWYCIFSKWKTQFKYIQLHLVVKLLTYFL